MSFDPAAHAQKWYIGIYDGTNSADIINWSGWTNNPPSFESEEDDVLIISTEGGFSTYTLHVGDGLLIRAGEIFGTVEPGTLTRDYEPL